MISLEQLRNILSRNIREKTPQAIELRMPGETVITSANADAVINELAVRGVDEVDLLKCDCTYLVEHDFLYALTVEVR